MAPGQLEIVAAAIFSTLQDMLRGGKNENMLRNAYIKYMCWLYYKFERIVNQLGGDALPKILYDGAVSHYELQLLAVELVLRVEGVFLLQQAVMLALELVDAGLHLLALGPDLVALGLQRVYLRLRYLRARGGGKRRQHRRGAEQRQHQRQRPACKAALFHMVRDLRCCGFVDIITHTAADFK